MLTSWRCFSVSVWNSRRVDPDVKAIQTPTPATAMWEITIPSSWWASKWFCKKHKGSVGRFKSRISLNLSYQLFSVSTVSSSSLTRTKLLLPCSGYVLIAIYDVLISLGLFLEICHHQYRSILSSWARAPPNNRVTQIFWFLKILHDRGWQAQNSSDLKGFHISLFILLWENYCSCTFIYRRTSISKIIKKNFSFVLLGVFHNKNNKNVIKSHI